MTRKSFDTIIFFVLLALFSSVQARTSRARGSNFVKTDRTHFVLNGKPLYFNGFNSYWLMYEAADPTTREKVTSVLQQASIHGLNVARTWAFSDGGYRALQSSPGSYNEDMFKVM